MCALAVDLRLSRRIDKYMAWGIAILAGAKVHDKQSQADNKTSKIHKRRPPTQMLTTTVPDNRTLSCRAFGQCGIL